MNILYLDVDSLRPDHLGCYGYHRATSPNMDRIAAEGVRFNNCYTSDAPCLPSRTALFSGLFGIHSGVVNHGGVASQPHIEGPTRAFRDRFGLQSWPVQFRRLGYRTATVSSFGERHSAWHWYAGFNEVVNCGRGGMESAHEVAPMAIDWLERSPARQPWFLHVNLWDPHTPYRVPTEYGDPFASDPLPAWYSEGLRRRHWEGCGPHSAREAMGYSDQVPAYLAGRDLPRQPWRIDSMEAARRVFDGYDTGVRYADDHIGRIFDALRRAGLWETTAVVISADHGEALGELNVYGDHQCADQATCGVPMIVRWPGVTDGMAGRAFDALHYQSDCAATLVELAGGAVQGWDGASFAGALRSGRDEGREFLVLSQGAWCVQRGVRWGDLLYLRTWHDAWHDYPEEMLFDVVRDPHELTDLAAAQPDKVREGASLLRQWRQQMLASGCADPLDTVLAEGGSLHAKESEGYFDHLRATDRGSLAEKFERRVMPVSAT